MQHMHCEEAAGGCWW